MQEIICVLDKSGSMRSVKDDALGGFNKFIDDQKAIDEAGLTVVWFDDQFDVGYEGKLSEMKPVTDWPNGGMTGLRDAIGRTFAHVRERFAAEKPEKVIMAILTDGFENCSHKFSKEAVANLIKEHQEKYGWDVIFLAADQDAWATAQHYGILKENAVNYNSLDTRGGFAEYSCSVATARMK
ncbi:MAG: hypothetical protein KZQ94_16040 [Candidatus Thiodiazotropha sp. (ex Troendleina suluensis)]|nr:hypothetical protein [Candidatus Thiodiazotropha sp. (ex Troendleina suluensis)]